MQNLFFLHYAKYFMELSNIKPSTALSTGLKQFPSRFTNFDGRIQFFVKTQFQILTVNALTDCNYVYFNFHSTLAQLLLTHKT